MLRFLRFWFHNSALNFSLLVFASISLIWPHCFVEQLLEPVNPGQSCGALCSSKAGKYAKKR
jgi:hypothetical protein